MRTRTANDSGTIQTDAMATLGLDDDELRSVEQMLSRLAQLSSSIQSLKMDIIKSNPLPHP